MIRSYQIHKRASGGWVPGTPKKTALICIIPENSRMSPKKGAMSKGSSSSPTIFQRTFVSFQGSISWDGPSPSNGSEVKSYKRGAILV